MSKQNPYPLPVLGVDLLSDETSIHRGAVRHASNVDIDRIGRYKRRAGVTVRSATSGLHSLYYAPQRGWTFVVKNSTLYRLNTSTYALTELYTLKSNHPVDYTEYNGNVYFSNRTSIGWLPSDSSTVRDIGVPTPEVNPTLSETVGTLLPGTYGVVITSIDDRGEESGATALQLIELSSGGGILFTNLPEQSGWYVNFYLTSADGEILRLAESIPAVYSSYAVTRPGNGAECDTQFLRPLPPGDSICWHNGRLVTLRDGALYFSEAMRPHVNNAAHGFIPLSGSSAFVASVNDGIYVGDSRGVWFLAGTDPDKFEQRLVSSTRAVPRSSFMCHPSSFSDKIVQANSPVAVWLSTAGYMAGVSGGNVVKLQADRIKLPSGLSGRSTFVFKDGIKQVITLVGTATAADEIAVDTTLS